MSRNTKIVKTLTVTILAKLNVVAFFAERN
jgi:hypothetical protein